MTREEAAEILEEVKTIDDSMYQKYMDALDVAITLLRNEPDVDKERTEQKIIRCKDCNNHEKGR